MSKKKINLWIKEDKKFFRILNIILLISLVIFLFFVGTFVLLFFFIGFIIQKLGSVTFLERDYYLISMIFYIGAIVSFFLTIISPKTSYFAIFLIFVFLCYNIYEFD